MRIHSRLLFVFVAPSKLCGMVPFPILSLISLFFFSSLILIVQSSSSSPTQPLNNFDPNIDLFGDAEVVHGRALLRLTRPSPFSSGLLLRRNPITFSGPISLSSEFSFSISPDAGDGLVLVLIPSDFSAKLPGNHSFGLSLESNFLAIEFDTSKDDNVGDMNANHVGLDVGSFVSVAVANVSAVNLVLNCGEKLNSWVDYEANSKTIQVRLSKFGEPRPSNPIMTHVIDLPKIWGNQNVFMGISSSNDANSIQVVSVYSWRLRLRNVLNTMHSQPVDPRANSDKRSNFRPWTLLAGVIFGTGCVALLTFVVLFMWVIFFHRHEESLDKIPEHPAPNVRYERIDVAVDKNTEEDEN